MGIFKTEPKTSVIRMEGIGIIATTTTSFEIDTSKEHNPLEESRFAGESISRQIREVSTGIHLRIMLEELSNMDDLDGNS